MEKVLKQTTKEYMQPCNLNNNPNKNTTTVKKTC